MLPTYLERDLQELSSIDALVDFRHLMGAACLRLGQLMNQTPGLLDRLDLLRQFYDEVLIPPAVWKEVVEQGRGRAGAREVEEAARSGWLKVEAPTHELLLGLLKRDLDDGEAEAIALAVQRFRMSENLYQQALKAVNEDLT